MQLKMLSPRQNLLSYAAAFAFILTMVGVAAAFNDREIVLPEMAAMAVALWAYRDQPWMSQPEKIFWWPSLTALMGFGINFLPLPFVGKLVLALAGMLLLFGLAPLPVWSGFAYLLGVPMLVLMFLVEYAVRCWVLPREDRTGLISAIRAYRQSTVRAP